MRTLIIFIILVISIGIALANERIPERVLIQDYQQCLQSVSRTSLGAQEKTQYCSCVRDEIGNRFTLAEYTRLSVQMSTNTTERSTAEKLSQIAQACMAQIFSSASDPRRHPNQSPPSQSVPPPSNATSPAATSQNSPPPARDIETRLRELRRLLDQNLITRAEHDARRKAILDDL